MKLLEWFSFVFIWKEVENVMKVGVLFWFCISCCNIFVGDIFVEFKSRFEFKSML